MTIRQTIPIVALVAATLSTSPVFAQDKGREKSRAAENGKRRDDGRAEAQRRDGSRAQSPRREEGQAPAPRREEGQAQAQAQRRDGGRAEAQRDNRGRDDRNRNWQGSDRSRDRGRAVPRSDNRWDNRNGGKFRGAPRVYAPRYSARYQIKRPYIFKPQRQLSFGLYLGYGVPYAYRYDYPVRIYGYGAPSASVYINPRSTLYGGVTLEIWPGEADVIVDGQYVGQVYDFDGTEGPLNLRAGRHRLEIEAPGFEPLVTDIDVYAGQLVPFRGEMRSYR